MEVNAEMEGMAQRNRDTFVQEIFASIATDIDFLSSFFSFGLDQSWRKRLVSLLKLTGGEKVLDVCTGTGKLAFLLSKKVGEKGQSQVLTSVKKCSAKLKRSSTAVHRI